ncbi:GGDEF domain-containing protein [Sphingorhabdus lutea]|nr:GGDEF domain-containing protein [Sphingorhabdus lutea]
MTVDMMNDDENRQKLENLVVQLRAENLALKNQVEHLQLANSVDELTAILNRRSFLEALERWCWRLKRYSGQYALAFIDVDNLKQINDQYGHSAGDAVLVHVAQILSHAIRKSDFVGRLGGDEFGILLDTIDPQFIQHKARNLGDAISSEPVEYEGQVIHISASIGIVPMVRGQSALQIMTLADEAMYNHKRAKGIVKSPLE